MTETNTATRRDAHGRFVKGVTGNAGGRPVEVAEVRALAREHTAEAVQRLVAWMRSDNPRASVAATEALLARGWGRPEQPGNGRPLVGININAAGGPFTPFDALQTYVQHGNELSEEDQQALLSIIGSPPSVVAALPAPPSEKASIEADLSAAPAPSDAPPPADAADPDLETWRDLNEPEPPAPQPAPKLRPFTGLSAGDKAILGRGPK